MYFYLKNPNEQKETSINLIFYAKDEPTSNKNFKYSTKQKISPQEWDFSIRYPKLKRGAIGKKNKQISLVLDDYKKLLETSILEYQLKNKPLTKFELRKIFDKTFKYNYKSSDLPYIISDAMDFFMKQKNKSKGMSKNWNSYYKNMRNKIILFDHYRRKVTSFSDINQNWLDEYCGFLREFKTLVDKKKASELKSRVNSKTTLDDNSLHKHIRMFFLFLDWVKSNYGVSIVELKNTARQYSLDKIHLTDKEVELLENVKVDTPTKILAKDVFLLGIYSGQRFSDYSIFGELDIVETPLGELLIKRTQKTNQDSFIPLTPQLKNLLEKYNWNIPEIHIVTFNRTIKKICREAGINKKVKKFYKRGNITRTIIFEKWEGVSSHVARRTFITLASEKGMPDHILMKITGITKSDTLTKYKRTSQESVLTASNNILATKKNA